MKSLILELVGVQRVASSQVGLRTESQMERNMAGEYALSWMMSWTRVGRPLLEGVDGEDELGIMVLSDKEW